MDRMQRSSAAEAIPPTPVGSPGDVGLPPEGPWHRLGEELVATGSTPWFLRGPELVWILEEGTVDVFAVGDRDGQPSGRRHHVFRAEAPALLEGLRPSDGPEAVGLLVVPVGEARARRTTQAAFRECALATSDAKAEGARLVTRWIEGLGRGVAPGPRPRGAFLAQGGSPERSLDKGETLEAAEEGVWVRVVEGVASLCDGEASRLEPSTGWLPLATPVWLRALEPTKVEIATTASLLDGSSGRWPDAGTGDLALPLIAHRRAEAEREAVASTAAEESGRRDEIAAALASAASLLGRPVERVVVSRSHVDAVLAACQVVGRAARIEFRRPPARHLEACLDPIDEIARASRVRAREVRLEGDWWTRDNGPLVAVRTPAQGARGAPVALVPLSPRAYRLVDPATGSSTPVDRAVAGTLEPLAHMFYRPLPETRVTRRTLLSYALRPNLGDVAMVMGMAFLSGLLAMIVPVMTAVVFGTIVPAGEGSQLGQVAIGLMAAGVATAAFGLVKDFSILRLEGRANNALEAAIWDRLLALPVEFFRGYSPGDLVNRANGINVIRQLLTGAALNAILTGVFSIFSLLMIFYYSWKLALLAILLSAIAVVAELLTGWGQLHSRRESADRAGRLDAVVLQQLTAVAKLRVAGAEPRAFSRWMEEFLGKARFDMRARLIQAGSSTFSASWSILSTLLVFGVYYFFLGEGLGTGDFMGFNAAFGQFMHAQLGAAGAVVSLVRAIPLLERAAPILAQIPETHSGRGDPGELSGEIELREATFRYAQGSRPVLDGVSLRIRPGEYVAFVGATGAGKSTIVKLLLGFETPESGEVLYDGKDLRGLDPVALRRQLGIVLQDGRLLAGDVFHNIVGSTRLDEADAWRAAEAAAIADEIRALPMGMHTYVSEGGGNISGGQRQRLLLARALVHRPAVVILDEATSALDNESQAKVIESLDGLQATRLVIAHRLSTIRTADRICVLEGGKIVQEGRFEDLMRQPGTFREIARRQLL